MIRRRAVLENIVILPLTDIDAEAKRLAADLAAGIEHPLSAFPAVPEDEGIGRPLPGNGDLQLKLAIFRLVFDHRTLDQSAGRIYGVDIFTLSLRFAILMLRLGFLLDLDIGRLCPVGIGLKTELVFRFAVLALSLIFSLYGIFFAADEQNAAYGVILLSLVTVRLAA